ncbi:OmpA family protein [Sulfurovum sp. bin170]|uniref:OmpA family protein n=1 Tax=Sulfurovum sp. bin170 TaxID=2695268 RepID=UPI0013DF118E|nr:OmpA family protein [Sulfurovum sp. bin170]NEW60566.1 OmpA family protein [Sulfurovum sp. bin170]
MKKRLTVTLILSALLMIGCAQKEISSIGVDGDANGNIQEVEYSASDINGNQYEYENVDLYGKDGGSYTHNSSYGEESSSGIKNIYFSSDQYNITPDKLHIVRNNAQALNSSIKSGARVKIEGHCDASGTDEYNYALGLRRAKSARDAIVSSGIRPSSITMVSMGESSPECTSGYSNACYAKNRRVEFKVIR